MHDIAKKEVQLIIDVKYVNKQTSKIYINKQTNNIYRNKQTTAKAQFNPNSLKNVINVKTTFKNILHNLMHIDFTIYCLKMSNQIGNVSKQGKNLYKQTNNNYGLY